MKEEEDGASNPTFDTLRDVDEVCKSWNTSPNFALMLKVVQSINLNASQVSSSVLSKIVSYLLSSEPHSVFYALLLLDACSRHCVDAFIRKMASRDVVKPVTRLVQKYWAKKSKFKLKKGQYKKPHVLIGELSARLVLHWSRSYLDQHRHPIYPIFRTSFETLRQRGDFKFNVSFPDANQPSEYGLEMFDDVVTVKEKRGGRDRKGRTSSSSSSKPSGSYVNTDANIPQIIERIAVTAWESINLLKGLIKGLKPGEMVEVEVGMAVVKQLEKDREVVNEYVQDYVKNEAVLKYLLRVSDAIDDVMKEYEKSERSVKSPRDSPALGYLPPPTAVLPPPSSQPLPSQPLSHSNPFTPFVSHTPPAQAQPFATNTPPTNPFLTNFSQTPSPVRSHSLPSANRRASSPAPQAKSPFAVDAAARRASNPFLPQGYQNQYQGQVLQSQGRSPFAPPASTVYNPFVTTPPS
eukprot:TRINITY_DN3205_c0_g1_i2.p1 TRINITY_DN3205_c0_g1~~TRINITY_DN3205_c0_g1_i2.p1  ORF type:complete len:464 (+),score=99.46 TRINITY_DN3205_c0_g1_i2:3-1394(+)